MINAGPHAIFLNGSYGNQSIFLLLWKVNIIRKPQID